MSHNPFRNDYTRHEIDGGRSIFYTPNDYYDLRDVGQGAYGIVACARHRSTKRRVAIKKCTRALETSMHCHRTYREIKLLSFCNNINILRLRDVFTPATTFDYFNEKTSVYLITDYLVNNLDRVIRHKEYTEKNIPLIIYQLFRGLKYIHSAGIIHRDLKPGNIIINSSVSVKIIDFGMARQERSEMTGYVATRWYRAPEIMTQWEHYDNAVDIWSVGCILGELFTGEVVFPGNDYLDLLKLILDVIGKPTTEEVRVSNRSEVISYFQTLPYRKRLDFHKRFKGLSSSEGINLLDKLLLFDPRKRLTACEALSHPYLSVYHDESDEPIAPSKFQDPYEDKNLEINDWKKVIWETIKDTKTSFSDDEDEDDDDDDDDDNDDDDDGDDGDGDN
ncbi:hypothetical protein SNEBB_009329 [Seison nebaliae]|nr:hypothetical protein SNEBB_009329 [Seison nebaliae]